MKAVTRITFCDDNDEKFFGEGPCRLLHAIEETGSLRSAAISMGLAYTKALRIIKNAEAALGFPLTTRCVGGKSGGGSTLTPQGKEWLTKYETYRDACVHANRKLYLEIFSDKRQKTSDPHRRQGKRQNNTAFCALSMPDAGAYLLGGSKAGRLLKGQFFFQDRANRQI